MKRRLAEIKEAKARGYRANSAPAREEVAAVQVAMTARAASAPAETPEPAGEEPLEAPAVPDINWIKRRFTQLTDTQSHFIIQDHVRKREQKYTKPECSAVFVARTQPCEVFELPPIGTVHFRPAPVVGVGVTHPPTTSK